TVGARNAPARHKTLEATIAWSYELLDGDERDLFDRLAVFVGSFDLEAAETVCAADIDVVQSLVDKSLLRQTQEGRLFMLETIREFAEQRFELHDDVAEQRMRHARHFLGLVDRERGGKAGAVLVAGGFRRVARDYGNIRAAL